jgi:hypothetical protein
MLCGSIGARLQSKLPRTRLPTAFRDVCVRAENPAAASARSKPRRKMIAELPARMERAHTRDKRRFLLRDGGVGNAAIDRAYHRALLPVEKANALAAFVGRDVIDVLPKRRIFLAVELPLLSAFVNRAVGARWRAKAAIDALFGDQRRHIEGRATALPKASAPFDATYPGTVRISAPVDAGKGAQGTNGANRR